MSDSSADMIRHMADEDKPREKALTQGIGVLTDAELLAILLRVGVKGHSVISVARRILACYDNDLARLSKATPRELSRLVPGIGPTKAITVIAALELGLRARGALALASRKPRATSSREIYDYMLQKLELLNHEEFWVVTLNQRLGIIGSERISTGGITSTLVDVKMLFKHVIDAQCPAIALIHNHPSGAISPSMADDELTRKICAGAKLLDIRVLDHLIITSSDYYSYADNGRLPQ